MRRPVTVFLLSVTAALLTEARVLKFVPAQGGRMIEMWRLTNDPPMRGWALYHSRECWSPDGRHVCGGRHPAYFRAPEKEARAYDLFTGKVLRIERAQCPRWAHHRNWLFYVHWPKGEKLSKHKTGLVFRRDMESGKTVRLPCRARYLGTTDCRDEWIYANAVELPDGRSAPGARFGLRPVGPVEALPVQGRMAGNPRHPRSYTRARNIFIPFRPSRVFFDPDGSNVSIGHPSLQQCHASWSGDGRDFLHGNGPMRGRLWNEPFPSNLHVLTCIGAHDISRCGRSGRWILGSDSYTGYEIGDTRSGDGWQFMEGLSYAHSSAKQRYDEGSFPIDGDGKGSPDGTKVCFVTTYDMKDGPVTWMKKAEAQKGALTRLRVASTEGFPEKGRLTLAKEIIGYERKTPTTFEGLERGLYGTRETGGAMLWPGAPITSFDARLLPEDRRDPTLLPAKFRKPDFADRESPLLWQRRTDIYVAVVRRPDRPWLRPVDRKAQLVPGENHWETYGYHVLRDGRSVTRKPLRPGEGLDLPGPGVYTAVAIEWSGLESKPSNPLRLAGPAPLLALRERPKDFSWTSDRWRVGEREVSRAEAARAPKSIREIVHCYDGVIHREWREGDHLAKPHDLNSRGQAIRRLFYKDGELVRREYYSNGLDPRRTSYMPEGLLRSVETFDKNGDIVESVFYHYLQGKHVEWRHWWYVKGAPVKFVARRASFLQWPKGPGVYGKKAGRWVKLRGLGPRVSDDTRRRASAEGAQVLNILDELRNLEVLFVDRICKRDERKLLEASLFDDPEATTEGFCDDTYSSVAYMLAHLFRLDHPDNPYRGDEWCADLALRLVGRWPATWRELESRARRSARSSGRLSSRAESWTFSATGSRTSAGPNGPPTWPHG